LWCICCVSSAAERALPREVEQTLRSFHHTQAAEAAPAETRTRLLYKWIEGEMKSCALDEVLQRMSTHIAIITNEHSLTWQQRLDAQNTNTNPRMVVMLWQEANRAAAVMRLDYPDNALRDPGYLVSSQPFLVCKTGSTVASYSFGSIYEAAVGSFACTFHGFIPGPGKRDWPDILISEGPAGSGAFVYWFQIHNKKGRWYPIWEQNCAYVVDFHYDSHGHVLEAEFAPEAFSVGRQWFTNVLHWGGR